jgi:hypothetical protein
METKISKLFHKIDDKTTMEPSDKFMTDFYEFVGKD